MEWQQEAKAKVVSRYVLGYVVDHLAAFSCCCVTGQRVASMCSKCMSWACPCPVPPVAAPFLRVGVPFALLKLYCCSC